MTFDVNLPDKWEADYQRGTDGWDLAGPTPGLKRIAASGRFPPGRMLVPCAGRGHDAREFARHGFQVTAIDFSETAVQEMRRLADPAAPVDIIQHDMFTLPRSMDGTFDYVLQYTCFCAIDPARREDYAGLVARLLKPDGLYIDLAFPLDGRPGGPPFSVSVADITRLFEGHGFTLVSLEQLVDSVSPRRGKEELLVFRKRG